jgi:hypothetical protein
MNTPDFSDLSGFVDNWGLESAHERLQKRSAADLSDLKVFYDAVTPRLEEIIEFLNQFPVNEIPQQFKPIAYMALAICEVDDAINVWKSSILEYISEPYSWRVKSSYYDYR